jgi:predicted lipid-binding transport protein (Tim44 family)
MQIPMISLVFDSGQHQADVPQEPFVQAVRDYQAKMQSTITLAAAGGLAGGIAAGYVLGFLIGRFAGSSGGGDHNGNGRN